MITGSDVTPSFRAGLMSVESLLTISKIAPKFVFGTPELAEFRAANRNSDGKWKWWPRAIDEYCVVYHPSVFKGESFLVLTRMPFGQRSLLFFDIPKELMGEILRKKNTDIDWSD